MLHKVLVLHLLFLLGLQMGMAQSAQFLKPEDAVKTALSQSFNIQFAEQGAAIGKVYNNIGTAGILPTLTLNAAYGGSVNNIDQRFSNGLQVQQNGVGNNTTTANAAFNWVVFDGLRMLYAKQRLSLEQQMSETVLADSIQNVIARTLNVYYRIAASTQEIQMLEELITYGAERLSIAEAKLNSGIGDKSPVLQARIDLNSRKAQLREQQNEIRKLKAGLNLLMGRNIEKEFTVEPKIMPASMPDEATLKKALEQNNPQWKLARQRMEQTRYMQRELQGQQYPRISLNAGYGYNLNRNQAGFALYNQNLGFTYGIGLSYAIFNGYTLRPQLRAAGVMQQRAQTEFDFLTLRLELRLLNARLDYETALDLYLLEEQNLPNARENMEIAQARYRTGSTDQLTLRTAQESYAEATRRYTSTLIRLKAAELELLRQAALLVK
jgi:outer membrane protein TolC